MYKSFSKEELKAIILDTIKDEMLKIERPEEIVAMISFADALEKKLFEDSEHD